MSFLTLWVGVGALGGGASIVRFLLDGFVSAKFPGAFPLDTLVVNLSGTLVLGILVGVGLHGDAFLLGASAVLGSYTTFSTWLLDSASLAEQGRRWMLVANLLLSIVLGVGAAELGRMIGGA